MSPDPRGPCTTSTDFSLIVFDWLLFSRHYVNIIWSISSHFLSEHHVYLQTNFMHFNASMNLYQITGATFLDLSFFREVIRAISAC